MALERTPLFDSHVAAGARLVDFGGWEMPLHYGSQIEEHHAGRRASGMFDVSHMTIIDLAGADAAAAAPVANDVSARRRGPCLYGVLLNDAGGVVDDLIVYRRAQGFRAVVTHRRAAVLRWFTDRARVSERGDYAAAGSGDAGDSRSGGDRPLRHRLRQLRRRRPREFNALEPATDDRAHRLHRRRRHEVDAL
jgi:glycine cleavage system aminomethyltransferase T